MNPRQLPSPRPPRSAWFGIKKQICQLVERTSPAADTALRMERTQQAKPKTSRASTPKVRTGCITCKKRRVKCDEGKPHCGNCLKTRGRCEGYIEPRVKRPGVGQLCWDSKEVTRAAPPKAQLRLNLGGLDFRDATGYRYFREFVDLAQGPWIAAGSTGSLWRVTLPQLSRTNDTLRHAAMAIGALSIWHRQNPSSALSAVSVPSLPRAAGDAHYFEAVFHYCHSLKLQSQHGSVLDTVLLSVMLLYFETMRGNGKAALDHINHGLALLLALMTDDDSDRHVSALSPDPKPLLASVANIFSHLAPYTRTVLRDRVGHGVPLPNFRQGLENKKQTLETFLVLLSEITPSSSSLGNIPAEFKSFHQFEEFWAASKRDQTAIGPVMMDIAQSSGVLMSNNEDSVEDFYITFIGDPRLATYFEASMKEMEALDAAFMPLFTRSMMADNQSPEYLQAIHLRLQYMGIYVFGNAPQYIEVESLRARTPLFRDFLSLAEVALRTARSENSNPAHRLSLQRDLAFHIMLTALFCRDPVVRDQAVLMLRDYPGQDGLWNTRALYALSARNRNVEQENAAEGTADEQWRRLWRREYVFEEGGDRVVFRYLKKAEVGDKWELVEEAADVKDVSGDVVWERQPLTGDGKLLMGI
ncbi:uncharacterized protein DNG_04434 [Cephalotrichum gorgonifer]|uniref:Zn(2)-C6 fungal-type domain-containing protein n=1 Tax=Cephalotrichum gorgonifer TaxID=2041049 RepID=A0AAE8MW42_9PEZI|nr:uncharacterized protein DNG_04434 [Cephalotrichum gorgonifer]